MTEAQPAATPLWPDNPTSTDLLGFTDIANPVIDAVGRERLDPVAVGIFGDWGCGKSTILEIIAKKLSDSDNVIVVSTRPWEYDPGLDPRASLIEEVLSTVRAAAELDEGNFAKVKDQFDKLTKRINWSKAMTLVTKSAVTLSLPSIDSLVDVFSGDGGQESDPSLAEFRDEFAKVLGELDGIERVVVLVDDLDRCLPETVVVTLETIKLFLSVPKMAFVVAADSRLVELSIAQRFGESQQGARMAREYLEKIVQIPVTVPALGLGDTEAYLALMLVDRHLDGNEQALIAVAEFCDTRRRSGEPRAFKEIGTELVPAAASQDVVLAGILAPVLFEGLNGNPRRLKRFLNAFWIRSGIAAARGAALDEAALAKLMVLEQLEPDAFSQLLDWLSSGTLKENLEKLEKGEQVPNSHSVFKDWASMSPPLSQIDLSPYLRLAASLRRLAGPRSDLRRDLAEILDELRSPTHAVRRGARQRLKDAPFDDRILVARELLGIVRIDPASQDVLVDAIGDLLDYADMTDELVDGLRQLDAARVDPGLIIAMGGDHASEEKAKAVIREWSQSEQLGDIAQAAADEVLGGAA